MYLFRSALLVGCALSAAVAEAQVSYGVAAGYTNYIGDSNEYHTTALAADPNANTYVTGSRTILLPGSATSSTDIFVAKVDTAGNPTVLATLSGKGGDQANGIALDPAGNIYIVGSTTSTNFPLHHPLQSVASQSAIGGTGFLVKMTADGTIVYSTYLGGTTGYSTMSAVAADAQGNAYVTGQTFASDYPHTAGLPNGAASGGVGMVSAAFVAKISPAGDKIVYAGGLAATTRICSGGSSCFLSTLATWGSSIGVDSAGNAYVAGNTNGRGLTVTPGAFLTDGLGAFVAKVSAAGTGLAYLTFLGTKTYGSGTFVSPANSVSAIAVDLSGNAYVAGSTSDPDFPITPSAFQTKPSFAGYPPDAFTPPPADGFVVKLNPTGSGVVWASYLGGASVDQAQTIAVDTAGDVWVSGTTQSTDFPTSSGFPGGGDFLVEFNSSGTAVVNGARYPGNSVAASLAIDSSQSGLVHAAGTSGLVSMFTPVQLASARIYGVANAAGGTLSGRVAPGEVLSIYGLQIGPFTPASAAFDSSGFLPTTLAGTKVTINGIPAPLLYVSGTQINLVAPLELTTASFPTLQVSFTNVFMLDFRLAVDPAQPQVFRHPDGSAAAINQDGTVNSQSNPAKAGDFVSIWATGVGFTQGTDGQMQTAPQFLCACAIHGLGGAQDEAPAYSGAAPGMVTGVVQINFRASATEYTLTANGTTSDPFTLFVAP